MARTDEEGAAPKGPVALRLGELEEEVQGRRRAGVAAGAVVKRDLARYYAALREASALMFPLPQGEAIVLALGERFNVAAAPYIWAEIEKQYRQKANSDPDRDPLWYLPDDFDPVVLIRRLSSLTAFESLALLDKVERYWVLHERDHPELFPEVIPQHLVTVGLCSDTAVKNTQEKREKEKFIARDMLRSLRDPEPGSDL